MAFNGKVLVVDDEPHIRKYLGLILRKLGCDPILEAGTGEEAVVLYEQCKPEMVLMDVNMPGMDGMQALERIMSIDPQAVVVMLTSLATRNVVEKCADLGASNFVRKDTPKDTISKVIAETIADNFEP